MKINFFIAKFFLVASFLGVIFIFTPAATKAAGITPSIFELNGVREGSSIKKEFRVVRKDANESIHMKVEKSGSGAEFISLGSNGVDFLPGETEKPFYFIIAPTFNSVGRYHVLITFTESDRDTGIANGTQLKMALNAKVNFSVVAADTIDFNIFNLTFLNSVEKKPIELTIGLQNNGNVSIFPDKYSLTIKNGFNNDLVLKKDGDIASGATAVPFSRAFYTVTTSLQLGAGYYMVDVELFYKNKQVFSKTAVGLSVERIDSAKDTKVALGGEEDSSSKVARGRLFNFLAHLWRNIKSLIK